MSNIRFLNTRDFLEFGHRHVFQHEFQLANIYDGVYQGGSILTSQSGYLLWIHWELGVLSCALTFPAADGRYNVSINWCFLRMLVTTKSCCCQNLKHRSCLLVSLVRGFLGFVKFKDFANRSPGLYALCLKRQHRFPGSRGLRGRSPGFEVNTDTADGLGIETGEMNHSISHVAPWIRRIQKFLFQY